MSNFDVKTSQHFNKLAPDWHMDISGQEAKIESVLTAADLHPEHTILDIGCGTGVMFPFVQKLTKGKANIFGADFAPGMVSRAHQEHPTVDTLCADALNLPIRDGQIDRIIAFHAFPHFVDHQQTLAECYRILRSGGEMCIFHLKCSRQLNAFHATLSGPVQTHTLPKVDELSNLMRQHHFTILQAVEEPGMYFIRAGK